MTNLRYLEEALAGRTDAEPHALKVASDEAPQVAPGLLAWIEGACDWEINRRCGRHDEFLPPEAPIDPSVDEVSIEAVHAMRAAFVGGDLETGARTFFDALIELLAGGERKH